MIENIINSTTKDIYRIFQDAFGEDRVDLQVHSYLEDTSIIKDLINASPESKARDVVYIPGEYEVESGWEELTIKEFFEKYPDLILEQWSYDNSEFLDVPYVQIIVHFPEITISNEYDESTTIKDLWAKVEIKWDGCSMGYFGLNRSNYTYAHWVHRYLHSHVSDIPLSDMQYFMAPCLGSGPILNTVRSLQVRNDLSLWELFCLELDRYVRNESLAGTPYKRLVDCSTVSNSNTEISQSYTQRSLYSIDGRFSTTSLPWTKQFLLKIIRERLLKFTLVNNTIVLGMSFEDCALTLSNAFIQFMNAKTAYMNTRERMDWWQELKAYTLMTVIKKKGKFCNVGAQAEYNTADYVGQTILKFKGHDVYLQIETPEIDFEENSITLLNPIIITTIVTKILTILNYEKTKLTDTINQRVIFI